MDTKVSDFVLNTPVVFLVFNRPDTTTRVFEEIRRVRPPKLLVVADGPRADRPGESEKCQAVRAIIESVDWPCEVLKNYSDLNLGCKLRVSSGLDWVFEQVEEAIILEDDCLPHPSFFRFCEELLEKYRHDERIFMISGNNFQFGTKRTTYSYQYSIFAIIWGWATWRRSWHKYDVTMRRWPEIRDGGWLYDVFLSKRLAKYFNNVLDDTYKSKVDTWDYQLFFTSWVNAALNIMPTVNLVSNIGFGKDATHTTKLCKISNLPTEPISISLVHPPFIIRDSLHDYSIESIIYGGGRRGTKLINKFYKLSNTFKSYLNNLKTKL